MYNDMHNICISANPSANILATQNLQLDKRKQVIVSRRIDHLVSPYHLGRSCHVIVKRMCLKQITIANANARAQLDRGMTFLKQARSYVVMVSISEGATFSCKPRTQLVHQCRAH